jgi:hypothetical protein
MSAIKPVIRELREAVLKGMAHGKDRLHQLTDNMNDHLDDIVRQVRDKDKFDGAPDTPAAPRPYNPVRGEDGRYQPGSLPSIDELRALTRTAPDTAFYWSGRDANGVGVGPDGSGIAENIASGNGGRTLEQTLAANGVDPLPVWNQKDPESVRFWEDASAAFAENASGQVRAVVGSDLRPGNIWQTVEIPRLVDNPNVTSISQLDPDTGLWAQL